MAVLRRRRSDDAQRAVRRVSARWRPGDRPTSLSFPDGTTQTFAYDRLDLVRSKDRAGRTTTTTSYDALRRQVTIGDGLNRITRQTWCTRGSLSSVTDAKGNTTSWDRDVMARVTKETRTNGSFSTYAYDPTTGRLQSTTDPKQQVTTYSYSIDDSVASIAYTNAAIATPSVTMTSDPNYPRLATMTDGVGTTTYAYVPAGTQGAGQPATVDGPLAHDTITYTSDELGRQTTRSLNGVTTTWSFDTLGRVQSEVDPIGAFTFAYDGVTSRLQQLAYPNGQTSTYSYFGNTGDHRPQQIHHQTGSGATLSRFT